MLKEPKDRCRESVPQRVGIDLRQQVVEAIEQKWPDLLRGIQIYVHRFGLARDRTSIDDVAREILQDTIVTALDRYENYDPDRPVRPWLLGIAINHLRHRRSRQSRDDSRYTLVTDSPQIRRLAWDGDLEGASEAELFDLLRPVSETAGSDEHVSMDELLPLVGASDREVLQLAFVEGLRGRELGDRLGITEGAAYTRQSRAIARLRRAYSEADGRRKQEEVF